MRTLTPLTGLQGVTIAWWTRARQGSTLTKLHHDWRSGTAFLGAVRAGRHMGLLGLACIVSTLVVVDGPLLQRSSTISTGIPSLKPVDLKSTMVPQLPRGYSGGWINSSVLGYSEGWSKSFNTTMPSGTGGTVSNEVIPGSNEPLALISSAFFQNKPMLGMLSGCAGKCNATLLAPALAQTMCSSRSLTVNYSTPGDFSDLVEDGLVPPLDRHGFIIASTVVEIKGDQEFLTLVTAYSSTSGCAGNLSITACDYISAVGEYSKYAIPQVRRNYQRVNVRCESLN